MNRGIRPERGRDAMKTEMIQNARINVKDTDWDPNHDPFSPSASESQR